MSAFARGMQLGQQAWGLAEANRLREEQLALEKEKERRAAELFNQQLEERQRRAAKENQLGALRSDLADYLRGVDRVATNAALDEDFNRADRAAQLGLALPPMRGNSNADNERALTVQRPVDFASPDFQRGLSRKYAEYALAAGDLPTFDKIVTELRDKAISDQDAAFVTQIIKDPDGDLAKQFRRFINQGTMNFTINTDPKTGFSSIYMVDDDRARAIELSPQQLGVVALGARMLERGDTRGLDFIGSVNKDLAARAKEEFSKMMQAAELGNQAKYRAEQIRLNSKELGLREKQLDAAQERQRVLEQLRAAREQDAQRGQDAQLPDIRGYRKLIADAYTSGNYDPQQLVRLAPLYNVDPKTASAVLGVPYLPAWPEERVKPAGEQRGLKPPSWPIPLASKYSDVFNNDTYNTLVDKQREGVR